MLSVLGAESVCWSTSCNALGSSVFFRQTRVITMCRHQRSRSRRSGRRACRQPTIFTPVRLSIRVAELAFVCHCLLPMLLDGPVYLPSPSFDCFAAAVQASGRATTRSRRTGRPTCMAAGSWQMMNRDRPGATTTRITCVTRQVTLGLADRTPNSTTQRRWTRTSMVRRSLQPPRQHLPSRAPSTTRTAPATITPTPPCGTLTTRIPARPHDGRDDFDGCLLPNRGVGIVSRHLGSKRSTVVNGERE